MPSSSSNEPVTSSVCGLLLRTSETLPGFLFWNMKDGRKNEVEVALCYSTRGNRDGGRRNFLLWQAAAKLRSQRRS